MGQTTSTDIKVCDLEIVYTPSILSAADQKDIKKLYKSLEKRRKEYRKNCGVKKGAGCSIEIEGKNTSQFVKNLLKQQKKVGMV